MARHGRMPQCPTVPSTRDAERAADATRLLEAGAPIWPLAGTTSRPARDVVRLCRMAAEIVPIRLGLTKGDLYTLWAPRWRDGADEWEAFLGKDEDLYVFESVADLVAFVRTNNDNDLTDHPAWEELTEANAHRLDPVEDRQYDVVGVPELAAEKPSEETVTALHGALAIVASIGSVCELAADHQVLQWQPGARKPGRRRRRVRRPHRPQALGRDRGDHWARLGCRFDALDGVISTPDVDATASEKAEAELAEPAPEPEVVEEVVADDVEEQDLEEDEEEQDDLEDHAEGALLGSDDDFWHKVGIDPVRLMNPRRHLLDTLRCYLDDQPVFLGRNGRINVFSSERALARYLADEHDHDLSGLATYDDIRTAANDGSLEVNVSDENVYVLTEIYDGLSEGPDAIDRDQLELAARIASGCRRLRRGQRGRGVAGRRSAAGKGGGPCARSRKGPAPRPAVRQGRRAVGGTGNLRGVTAAVRVAIRPR